MRLTDADKLIINLSNYALVESLNDNESTGEQRFSRAVYNAIQNCIRYVEEQPTAYDIDKVVERLKDHAIEFEAFGQCCDYVELSHAIEIVKGGTK